MRRKVLPMSLRVAANADRHVNRPKELDLEEARGKCTMLFVPIAVRPPKCRLSRARIDRCIAGSAIRPKERATGSKREGSQGTATSCPCFLFIIRWLSMFRLV